MGYRNKYVFIWEYISHNNIINIVKNKTHPDNLLWYIYSWIYRFYDVPNEAQLGQDVLLCVKWQLHFHKVKYVENIRYKVMTILKLCMLLLHSHFCAK